MMPGYHLLQFVPDPFVETGITIGALVDGGVGVRFEAARAGERLLPSTLPRASTTLLRALLAELQHVTSVRLPMSLGPHIRIGERVTLPVGVVDPPAWVAAHVLPTEAPHSSLERRHQRTRRPTMGRLFLKQFKMASLVKSRLRPEAVLATASFLRPVSHYVPGREEYLLLEPVYLDSDRFHDDLQDVATSLLAWQNVAQQKHKLGLNFSVYSLGTSNENLKILRDGFGESSIRVIDTESSREREDLFRVIRSTAQSIALQ